MVLYLEERCSEILVWILATTLLILIECGHHICSQLTVSRCFVHRNIIWKVNHPSISVITFKVLRNFHWIDLLDVPSFWTLVISENIQPAKLLLNWEWWREGWRGMEAAQQHQAWHCSKKLRRLEVNCLMEYSFYLIFSVHLCLSM